MILFRSFWTHQAERPGLSVDGRQEELPPAWEPCDRGQLSEQGHFPDSR